MKDRETYKYTNDLGRPKEINISIVPNENGEHFFSIWDLGTGDMTNSGSASKEDLKRFLKHYGISTK